MLRFESMCSCLALPTVSTKAISQSFWRVDDGIGHAPSGCLKRTRYTVPVLFFTGKTALDTQEDLLDSLTLIPSEGGFRDTLFLVE